MYSHESEPFGKRKGGGHERYPQDCTPEEWELQAWTKAQYTGVELFGYHGQKASASERTGSMGVQRTAADTHHVSVDLVSKDGHALSRCHCGREGIQPGHPASSMGPGLAGL